MVTPAWLGATAVQLPLASQVNQFLGSHAITYVYTGVSVSRQITAGSGGVASNGTYVAQSFTTGSFTTVGRIAFNMTTTGGPAPTTISLQTNNAGAPSGTVLVSTVMPPGWANAAPTYQSLPLPVTGLSASTTYWIVASAAGDASDFFTYEKSNQTSGTSTSTNGTSWTAQTYGLLYEVFDLSATPPFLHTWEDSNARITNIGSNTNATPAYIEEYTVAQGTNQFAYSYRTFSYSGTKFTSLS
jgi:hypothetical protein